MVVALPAEARAVLGRQRWRQDGTMAFCRREGVAGRDILWACSGLGPERAARAAARLLAEGVEALGIVGVSGGLSPTLARGQLVLAESVTDAAQGCWPVPRDFLDKLRKALMRAGLALRCGSVLTTPAPLLTSSEKASWFRRSDALAVDMESAAVACAAHQAGRPFFVLRAICDPASRCVPANLLQWVDEQGRARPLALLKDLFRRPALMADMWRVQGDFNCALRALEEGWRVLARHFYGRENYVESD
jgi:adenosylhomocysteine nucleosidase